MDETDWSRYEAIVGKRWDYYRPRFERFAQGEWLSWNWAAFFGTLAWLRYRKLYAWSWGYFFVSVPVLWLFYLAGTVDRCANALRSSADAVPVLLVVGVLCFVAPPLLADRIYFARVRSLVETAQPAGRKGGVGGYKGALVFQAAFVLFVTSNMAAYIQFHLRATVDKAVGMAEAAKKPLEEYLANKGRMPARIEELAVPATSRDFGSMSLASDGTVRVTFSDQVRELAGRSVSVVPVLKEGRVAEWICRSEDVPEVCLPPPCRR